VHCTHYGKHQQRAGPNVSRKTDKERKEAQHQHFLAIEAVNNESAERPDEKRCHDITRQHKPYHVLVGLELRIKIYGQQRSKDIEGKKEQEIAGHHLQVIGIPKSFRLQGVGCG
jgi:hypothetical protein